MAETIDLTPLEKHIVVRSGDVRSFRLVPSSPELWAGLTNDGAGGTWLAQVRSKESSADVAVTLGLVEEADSLVVIIPESTADVWGDSSRSVWKGKWDVQGMIGGTEPVTIASGDFTIERDVSR
jgi:hypothetical protein